jgi:hypothetical protein
MVPFPRSFREFFIYGEHPGASDELVDQASDVVEMEAVLIGVFWVVFLFFVPFLLHWLGGPQNAFAIVMFAWSVGASMLVGAYVLSLQEPKDGVKILGSIFAVLIGAFGGLGYTAAEVYLDYCAEWMATMQPYTTSTTTEAAADDDDDDDAHDAEDKVDTDKDKQQDGAEEKSEETTERKSSFTEAAVAAAKREIFYKQTASKYKNRFASQLYAIYRAWICSLLSSHCLLGRCFAGAVGSLFLPDWQEPSSKDVIVGRGDEAGHEDDVKKQEESEEHKSSSCCRNAFMLAGKSFMDCFRCLSAYNGLAALAIVPYFFTGAFADVYRYNVLLGPECAMQEVSDGGIGLEQVTLIALISTMTQAVTAFTAPLLVGTSKFLFQEHDYPMAVSTHRVRH